MATKKDKKHAKTKKTHHEKEVKKVKPQTRGLIDGSVNTLNTMDGANLLGVLAGGKIADSDSMKYYVLLLSRLP